MSASRPTGNRANRKPLQPKGPPLSSRADRAKVIGAIFAAVIVCTLVAGGVLPLLLDQASQGSDVGVQPAPEVAGPSVYEQELRAEIERQPENPQLMVSLANLLVAQGNGDEAIAWYERAVDEAPERIETRLDFGSALVRRGSLSDAEIQFERAIAINQGSADAHFLLGDLYLAWQPPRTDEAAAALERAIAAEPASVAAAEAARALASIGRAPETPAASPGAAVGSAETEDGE